MGGPGDSLVLGTASAFLDAGAGGPSMLQWYASTGKASHNTIHLVWRVGGRAPDNMLEKTPNSKFLETVSFEEHAGTRMSRQGPAMTDGVGG